MGKDDTDRVCWAAGIKMTQMGCVMRGCVWCGQKECFLMIYHLLFHHPFITWRYLWQRLLLVIAVSSVNVKSVVCVRVWQHLTDTLGSCSRTWRLHALYFIPRPREKNQCLKSGRIHNKWWWPDSPQPSNNLIYTNTPLWSAKCIFPFQTNLHTFFHTCFFHVLFRLPFFLWPTSTFNVLLKTWQSSLLNTWPYQWTLFAIANSNPIWTSNPQIFFCLWAVLHTLLST